MPSNDATQKSQREGLFFGSCWYPDLFPAEEWEQDLEMMTKVGHACVRWGEGSWTLFEPQEGVFDFSLLDAVLEAVARHGLGMILGTPTYAVPAWMKTRYPEVMASRLDGGSWGTITRRIYDMANPTYRKFCQRIVEEMAKRYAGDARIWAWQVDNEVYCHWEDLAGPSITRAFQDWLAAKYGSIAQLNEAWGLAFWSCQLDTFDQAELPRPVPTAINQHQKADYLRFLSDLAIDFLQEQADIIRRYDPITWILHNNPFGSVDKEKLFQNLDVFGVDHYPGFSKSSREKIRCSLNYADAVMCAPRVWTVEQQAAQPGVINSRNPVSAPGETALLTLQSIGAGSNAILWFNWRTFSYAPETIWGGLLPPWRSPAPVYDETSAVIAALAPHGDLIASTRPRAHVARLLNHTQSLLYKCEPWIEEFLGTPWDDREALRSLGLSEAQFSPKHLKPGDRFSVALLPHAAALAEGELEAITSWVEHGGTLIVGPLAGFRDDRLHQPTKDQPPGALGQLTGTRIVADTTWREPLLLLISGGENPIPAGHYAEVLETTSADVSIVASYQSGWLKGRPAITRRPFGRGAVVHCGVRISSVLTSVWKACGLPDFQHPVTSPSRDVEVLTREAEGVQLHFVLNHGETTAEIRTGSDLVDLLDLQVGSPRQSSLLLPGMGWKILRNL